MPDAVLSSHPDLIGHHFRRLSGIDVVRVLSKRKEKGDEQAPMGFGSLGDWRAAKVGGGNLEREEAPQNGTCQSSERAVHGSR